MKAFSKASEHYKAEFDKNAYLERTRRNHFWMGGPDGQMRLRNLKVAVAGLGGMGSNIAEALVRMGVGHLRIADPDHIERTNLNRQVIANLNTIGKSKAKASAEELRNIAHDFDLAVYPQGVAHEMVEEFVEGCDAIVDEIDVFPLEAHILLHRAARKRNIPLYSAYAVGVGVHFYKFSSDYTFEEFLGTTNPNAPTADDLVRVFGYPVPPYLDEKSMRAYRAEVATGGAPIFGPATILGHSIVATRLIFDLVQPISSISNMEKTPVMPEFLVLDPCEMSCKKFRVK